MLGPKNVVIVGGTSGIGLAIADSMLREGARVAIAGRDSQKLEKAKSLLGPSDCLFPYQLDVQDATQVEQFFTHLAVLFPHIDILILAAGVNIRKRSMAETTREAWDEVLGINVHGSFYCLQAALPKMRSRGEGLVIQISSVAGKRATALGGVAYCASKFAMTAVGIAAGNEANADGVRITNIYPGEVNTAILDHRPVPVTEQQRANMLQPHDVAEMVLALCRLPGHVHVPELVIKPLGQAWF